MDREWGSKPGSGGAASAQNEAIDRRERLRRLALETIDLAKDPYFMRNHLGRSLLSLSLSVCLSVSVHTCFTLCELLIKCIVIVVVWVFVS